MAQRVAEHVMRSRRFGPKIRLRVDLHGVSAFGPGDSHTLIRFEWLESIAVDQEGAGVIVRSTSDTITLPPGAFGLEPADLAQRLEEARSIHRRPEIIGQLTAR
jgi:hypothetical protein